MLMELMFMPILDHPKCHIMDIKVSTHVFKQ